MVRLEVGVKRREHCNLTLGILEEKGIGILKKDVGIMGWLMVVACGCISSPVWWELGSLL